MSTQSSLFDTAPEPWEQDDQSERQIASVVFSTGPDRPFDYLVPDRLRNELEPGRRVVVPFGQGNRSVPGYCVQVETRPLGQRRLKEILRLIDQQRLLTPSMLRLAEWMADYYLSPLGQVLEGILPAGVRQRAGTREAVLLSADAEALAKLAELKVTPKQRDVLQYLSLHRGPFTAAQLAKGAGCAEGPIQALRKKGLLKAETRRIRTAQLEEPAVVREAILDMNHDQQAALDTILGALREQRHETILIHGVTGSGKTEVYMQAIDEVVRYGRQAIVLVPEISLTPQTKNRFRARFQRIAVLHSHLSDTERHWQWERIARGEIQVVVGARSAIFAPTPHLGLVILDEEHEGSFKQDTAPRYHARDVALRRAAEEGVPLILGSATPSLESWRRAQTGTARLVEMPRRVFDRPLPTVGTIDLRTEARSKYTRGSISRQLHQAMDQALNAEGQIILLLNRRGFATHIQCPACGLALRCPHCDLSLTHHREREIALCHFCDYQTPAPRECPECHFEGIRYSGQGTQKLEAEVRSRFPNVAILRMDTDTMQKPGSHEEALAKFRRGEVRILLGTQMIAKGLDFPNVTLVGVINADTALHLPDFRAAERTFQLVTQVAGRTGRGERGGRVLVQTFSPEHPAIQAAVRHDFNRFAKAELPIRQSVGYPPFGSMVRLIVRGPSFELAQLFVGQVAAALRADFARQGDGFRVLGPAPAPVGKLRGLFRFHIQLQSGDGAALRTTVRRVMAELKEPKDVQWTVDVDPLDML
ncbi:MAG TPA: primosomal protein N' [Pirellulales bacterium]|jgi:primosomal protein N' (replication factor Y)|nr:primosomal protein N' [Pirellulales bacterium]